MIGIKYYTGSSGLIENIAFLNQIIAQVPNDFPMSISLNWYEYKDFDIEHVNGKFSESYSCDEWYEATETSFFFKLADVDYTDPLTGIV